MGKFSRDLKGFFGLVLRLNSHMLPILVLISHGPVHGHAGCNVDLEKFSKRQ